MDNQTIWLIIAIALTFYIFGCVCGYLKAKEESR